MALTGHGRPINQVGAFYVPLVSNNTDDTTTVLRSPILTDLSRVPNPVPWVALGTAAVLLAAAVAPAAPFAQYDWPQVTGFKLVKSRFVGRPGIGDVPIVDGPFTRPIWGSVSPVHSIPADQVPYNAALLTPPPVAQPFVQSIWEPVNPVASLPPQLVPYNANLYTVAVQAAPFAQLEWKPVSPPVRALDATQPSNINLFTNPIPFAQYDWPTVRGVDLVRSRFVGRAGITDAVAVPFYQTDWPVVRNPTPATPQAQPYNAALYTVTVAASPFSQTDWSKTLLPKPALVAQAATNIALLSLLSTPFSQTSWPKVKTQGPTSSVTVYNQPLYTTPGINADLNVTEADDTLSAAATLSIAASLTVTEGADSLTAAGTLAIAASSSPVEANDTLGATGALAIAASSALTEAPDTLLADGINGAQNTADLSVTEANDTLSAAGTVSADVESGDGRKYPYGWKPWRLGPTHKSRKKKLEEELEELEAFLRTVAVEPPLEIYKPVVYQGPLAAAFFEPIETIEQRHAVNARIAKVEAQRREDDDEEALLMLLLS